MAYVQFAYLRNCREVGGSFKVQAVTVMHFETGFRREFSRIRQPSQFRMNCKSVLSQPGFAILSGVQLNDRHRELDRAVDLPGIGIDEERNSNTVVQQLPNDGGKAIAAARDIESAFRGDFGAPLGQ